MTRTNCHEMCSIYIIYIVVPTFSSAKRTDDIYGFQASLVDEKTEKEFVYLLIAEPKSKIQIRDSKAQERHHLYTCSKCSSMHSWLCLLQCRSCGAVFRDLQDVGERDEHP